jgi:hypothetical protein
MELTSDLNNTLSFKNINLHKYLGWLYNITVLKMVTMKDDKKVKFQFLVGFNAPHTIINSMLLGAESV